jgi:hypothetical protein
MWRNCYLSREREETVSIKYFLINLPFSVSCFLLRQKLIISNISSQMLRISLMIMAVYVRVNQFYKKHMITDPSNYVRFVASGESG